MTLAAVGGAITPVVTGLTFPLTPAGDGDAVIIEVISTTEADYATALASSNVEWDPEPMVAHTALSANGVVSTVFKGKVTTAGEAEVTVTTNAGTPTIRVGGVELSTTAGYSAVTLDTSGTVNSATTLCPDLTPRQSGEAYFYFGFNAASSTNGTTSGYTFGADGSGNGLAYDAACTGLAQQPAFGASDTISGIAVMLYEAVPNQTATAALTVTPSMAVTTSGGTPGRTATAHLTVTPSMTATAVRCGVVQTASGSTTGTSLTLTFPAAVTANNAVIVCVAGYYDGTVSSLALGTSGGAFTHLGGSGGTGGNNAGIYMLPAAAESAATLTIATSSAGIIAYAYELTGTVVYFDVIKGGTGTGTSWSSGSSAETIPYPHWIFGIGAVVGNSGPVTGPSGWANKAAITNVAGADGHAVGAVSGYLVEQSAVSCTYSGTAADSSAWGAAVAAFLVVPRGGNAWGGYIFDEHSGYTGVTCTFTIPSSVPYASGTSCSIWVGLGNVYQTGIYLNPNSSYTGNVDTYPWSWWFGGGGGAGELWDTTAFPTAGGDSLTLTLTCDGSFWYATIANNTLGWSYTETRSVLGLNVSTWNQNTAGDPEAWGWIYPVDWAEVVIEQETSELPDYGSITFTAITTTPAISQLPSPQFTVESAGGGIDQYPGPFDLANGSYTIHWNQAG